jgi:hypothetical protein
MYNYKDHPHLVHSSGFSMELDVYYPEVGLAFEFQGRQHYGACFSHGAWKLQQKRDQEKKLACHQSGILLVPVPYWWDCKVITLAATIKHLRPDVILALAVPEDAQPIPPQDPQFQKQVDKVNTDPAAFVIEVVKLQAWMDTYHR